NQYPLSIASRQVGDISVWENLEPAKGSVPLPPPTKTLSLSGIVHRMINAPDGRWLYFLDTHNRKLGRIDTTTAAIDKVIDTLSPGTRSFCLTPDGKRIYCCSEGNRLDVIDTAQFKHIKTVRLNKGQPGEVAATNEGLVFLVGKMIPGAGRAANC